MGWWHKDDRDLGIYDQNNTFILLMSIQVGYIDLNRYDAYREKRNSSKHQNDFNKSDYKSNQNRCMHPLAYLVG